MSDIDSAYQKLKGRADRLYEVVILYHNFIYSKHAYDAENFNMIEMHTLTYINDIPGITATELSRLWHKSKSSISQTVKKLVEAGYVEKSHSENNEKNALLYVTEKGQRLSNIHKAYDVADITQTAEHLIGRCGQEDLDAFYRVLEEYVKLMKTELLRPA